MSSFDFVSRETWKIDPSVPSLRRQLLAKVHFEQIVDLIWAKTSLVRINQEKGDKEGKFRGLHRWLITLETSAEAIDLWHNSHGGYRAQYYVSQAMGEAANAYALECLASKAMHLLSTDKRRRRSWQAASVSIYHPHARVWIHQGLWCRHARHVDRHLSVARWAINPDDDPKVKRRKTLGSLIPDKETKIKLIGQWLSKDGLPEKMPPKIDRAKQINECGFV